MARTHHQGLRFGWADELKRLSAKGDHDAHDGLVDTIRSHVDQIGVFDRQWVGILNGATQRAIPVEIDKRYAIELFRRQGGRCALSGLPIGFGGGAEPPSARRRWGTASLDRISSAGAYSAGNVWWVHRDINRMKGDLQLDRFVELCRAISEHARSVADGEPAALAPPEIGPVTPRARVEAFIAERCERGSGRREAAADLLREFTAWTQARGLPSCSPMGFGLLMGGLGYLREKSSVVYWRGLALKSREGARVQNDPRATLAAENPT